MAKTKHMSRLAAPKTWPIKRKGVKWIATPAPGAHPRELSIPLAVCLKEIIQVAETTKDIKKLLNAKDIIVNGREVKDVKFSIGIFDVISIPKSGKNYRLVMNVIGKLNFVEISSSEAKLIVAKVVGKNTLKKSKQQINLSNGWNILSNDKYNIGDVLFIDVATRKPVKRIEFANGKLAYVVGGKHPGVFAKIKDMKEVGELKKRKIAIMKSEGETWETDANQLFVIGDKEAEIKLQ